MTREELKEKIKELITSGCGCDRYCQKHPEDCGCARDADTAIALVLEEAAKVADDEAGHCEETGSPPSDFGNAGRNDAAKTIAAAIRALKGEA